MNMVKNKSYMMIMIGLLAFIILSMMMYFGISNIFIHILLAASYVFIGVGIIFGFIKMISEDKG